MSINDITVLILSSASLAAASSEVIYPRSDFLPKTKAPERNFRGFEKDTIGCE
jgi:hypothetical protein